MLNNLSKVLITVGMLVSAIAANFLVVGMRSLLGCAAYAIVCLLTLFVALCSRLLSEKALDATSIKKPNRHGASWLMGAALVIASAYLIYYFIQILSSYLFSTFDMFRLGGTRDYMSVHWMIALLIYALFPAICRQAILDAVKGSFSERQSVGVAAVFYAAFCFRDGAAAWAVVGCFAMWLILKTGGIRYSVILDAMTSAITIALAKMNDIFAVTTGEKLDLSFAGGMNVTLLFGMGFILIDCALLAFVFGRIKLGARKLGKIELALLVTLAFAGFCIGCGLSSMGNQTHL